MAKKKSIGKILVFSILILAIAAFVIVKVIVGPARTFLVNQFISAITEQDDRIDIQIGDIENHIFNSVDVNNLKIFYNDEMVVNTLRASISSGLMDIIRIYRGKGESFLDVTLYSPEIILPSDLSSLNVKSNKEEQNSSSFISINARIINGYLVGNIDDVSLEVNQIYADVSTKDGLSLNKATFKFSDIIVDGLGENFDVYISSLAGIIDSQLVYELDALSISISDMGFISSISSSGSLQDLANIHGNVYVGNAKIDYLDYNFDTTSVMADYYLDIFESVFDINANFTNIKFEDKNGIISLNGLNLSYLNNNGDNQLYVAIKDQLLPGSNTLNMSFNSDDISLDLNFNNQLSVQAFQDESKDIVVNANLNNFNVSTYLQTFSLKVPILYRLIDEKTAINGYLQSLVDLQAKKGDIQSSLLISNMKFASTRYLTNFNLNAELDNDNIVVDNLSLSAFNGTVAFKGFLPLDSFIPQGVVLLTNDSDSSVIGKIAGSYNKYINEYSYEGYITQFENYSLVGHIDRNASNDIISTSYIQTKYKDYDLNVSLNLDTLSFHVEGEGFTFDSEISQDNNMILSGLIDDFEVVLSDSFNLHFDSEVNGIFNLDNKNRLLSFENLRINSEDKIFYNMDLVLENNDITISNISFAKNKEDQLFKGKVLINNIDGYRDLTLNVRSDIYRENTSEYIKFSYYNDILWSDINLSGSNDITLQLLGTIKEGISATCSVGDFDFEAELKDSKITISNVLGKFNAFSFYDADMVVNLKNKILSSSFKFEHTTNNRYGENKQGATIAVEASLDSITATALSIFGLNADADFKVSITDGFIGESFEIEDNDFYVKLRGKHFDISGYNLNGSYSLDDNYLDISFQKQKHIGFDASGYLNNDIDLFIDNFYIYVPILNQFIGYPQIVIDDGIITGNFLLQGKINDPSLYGMVFASYLDLSVFWAPDEKLSLKSPAITLSGHNIVMPKTLLNIRSYADGRLVSGALSFDIDLFNLDFTRCDFHLILNDKPADVWVPLKRSGLMMRADATGDIYIRYKGSNPWSIEGKAHAENGYLSLVIPPMPSFYYAAKGKTDVDLEISFGKNIELFYPDLDDPLINLSIEEGKVLKFRTVMDKHIIDADGLLTINSGRIYYYNNDFYITDGDIKVGKNYETSKFDFTFNLNAKLKQYDNNGNPVDIYLTLQDASFNNINPRLTGVGLTENEVIQILTNSIIEEDNFGITSVANLAYLATDTLSKIGYINTYQNSYSLSKNIKDTFNFDIFSFRSPILQNILVQSITGSNNNISLISRYLNGTSLFAGKYITNDLFLRSTVLLSSAKNGIVNNETGHFLTDDLNLDFEFSLDWDNPIGTVSIFTRPHELSVFNFLDNIGFTYTKRIMF